MSLLGNRKYETYNIYLVDKSAMSFCSTGCKMLFSLNFQKKGKLLLYIDEFFQESGISNANIMDLLQSYNKPSISYLYYLAMEHQEKRHNRQGRTS